MEIPQTQNSSEWLAWRRTHIGASEIPIILGVSKFCTPYVLWQRKLGFAEGQKDNWAMQRGREIEDLVLAMANEQLGGAFVPRVLVHPDLEWASASLDGIDYLMKAILEIKCPGLEDHQCAEKVEVPAHYWPQVQWQLFCSGLEQGYYVSYYSGEIAVVEFTLDHEYITDTALPAASEFYRCLVEMIEPPRNESDFTQISDPEFEEHARQWKAAHEMSEFYKKKVDFYRNKLIEYTDDGNCRGYGVSLRRVSRDGAVDWNSLISDISEKFPEVASQYPPESYRKSAIGYWKLSEDRK